MFRFSILYCILFVYEEVYYILAYHRCNLCSVYLYVMLCQVALRCLVLRISVPSLTLCCSVHLTVKDLNLALGHIWHDLTEAKKVRRG